MLIIAGLLVSVLAIFSSLSAVRENNRVVVRVKDKLYKMELAETPEIRQQGLSGRPELDENAGMLFRFEESAMHCFWMKDMNFDLDIIWLNYREEIVHIEENVSPSTYPNNFCTKQPAKFVLEFRAGTVKQLQLSVKDKILLPCLIRQGCYN